MSTDNSDNIRRGGATVNIRELGSLGEFVAAIATIATLIYLAVQIRLTAQTSRAEDHDYRLKVRHGSLERDRSDDVLVEIERTPVLLLVCAAYGKEGPD